MAADWQVLLRRDRTVSGCHLSGFQHAGDLAIQPERRLSTASSHTPTDNRAPSAGMDSVKFAKDLSWHRDTAALAATPTRRAARRVEIHVRPLLSVSHALSRTLNGAHKVESKRGALGGRQSRGLCNQPLFVRGTTAAVLESSVGGTSWVTWWR